MGSGGVLQGSGTGSISFHIRDVGDYPPHGSGPGGGGVGAGGQHRVAIRITGRQPQRLLDGIWE